MVRQRRRRRGGRNRGRRGANEGPRRVRDERRRSVVAESRVRSVSICCRRTAGELGFGARVRKEEGRTDRTMPTTTSFARICRTKSSVNLHAPPRITAWNRLSALSICSQVCSVSSLARAVRRRENSVVSWVVEVICARGGQGRRGEVGGEAESATNNNSRWGGQSSQVGAASGRARRDA